ncbi:carboxymuconolactone decarboxylase family protein [Rummeliibacillus pycnus]|uniref:carboxymuconolactone decarboxylase family protein n=1 Tax=Rummeliibacillus pycnus TaxID=101070 RepID=UPI003D2AC600
MAFIAYSSNGSTPFQKLLGHNEKVMDSWNNLGGELEKDGFLSAELKEQVRRTLAQGNGCVYCKAKGKPDEKQYDEKIAVSVGFAQAFLTSKGQTSPTVVNVLKEYFSDEEISELIAFICFTTASQYFGALMQLEEVKGSYR